MFSCLSEKPGPLVAVIALTPPIEAPITAAIEAISSSICTNTPSTSGSARDRRSAISEEGVIGIAGEEPAAGRDRAERAGVVAGADAAPRADARAPGSTAFMRLIPRAAASGSRCTRMAKSGHSHSHSRQPVHLSGSASSTMRSSLSRRQRSGQSLTQMSQLLHQLGGDFQAHAVGLNGPRWRRCRRRVAELRAAGSVTVLLRASSIQVRPRRKASRLTAMVFFGTNSRQRLFPVGRRKVERRGQRAEQHHVGGAFVAEFLGHVGGVDRIAFGDVRLHFGRRLARIAHAPRPGAG